MKRETVGTGLNDEEEEQRGNVFFLFFFVETLNKDSGVKILGKTEKELTKVYWSTNRRTAERKKHGRILALTVLTRPQKRDRNLRRNFIQE